MQEENHLFPILLALFYPIRVKNHIRQIVTLINKALGEVASWVNLYQHCQYEKAAGHLRLELIRKDDNVDQCCPNTNG